MSKGWIGVDLDGTLAVYDGWKGVDHIGEPVPAMVERVKRWLAEGEDVRIFTARISGGSTGSRREVALARMAIVKWCVAVFGQPLLITCTKDYDMRELYDDRCKQVVPNTGRVVGCDQCNT